MRWVHAMLIPRAQAVPEHDAHWERTLALIEETVFQREDLFAVEGSQSAASGANETILLGRLENGLQHFHTAIEDAPARRD